jgi:hypothetical protein
MNQILPQPIDGAFYMDSVFSAPPAPILAPEKLFGSGTVEHIVSSIEIEVRAEVYDIATPEGRERIKSIAYKIARSKTTLDEIGKEHVAHIKAQSAAIDKERKTIRDRLDALKEEVRGPLTAWEKTEEERVGDNEAALVAIIETGRQSAGKPSSLIRELITIVEGYSARDWQEFKERADEAVTETLQQLNERLAAAEQQERDQAELIELRRMKAEREEADRLAAAAAEAAEKARQESEQRAAREAEQAAQAAERERQRQEEAKRDREAAVAAAIETERRRQEAEAARVAAIIAAEKAAAEKRAANVRRRAKVHTEIRAALTCPEIAPHIVDRVIDAIAAGDVPHVSITY